ncbi:MAG TPA: hypothetical protein VIK25_01720, partial [Gemmatimonadaceae bacterium]
MILGDVRAGHLRLSARIVSVSRTSTAGTVTLAAGEGDIFPTERRLALSVARLLGHEPSAAERRAILDRPSTRIDAFLAYSAAVQAATDGELPRAEQLLAQALGLDASVNTAFDAAVLGAQLAASGASVVAAPTGQHETGEAPTDIGLATEGNDTEFGEAWFEGTGTRRLSLYEFAVPLTLSMGFGRSRLDVSTTFASNRVDTPANDVFHASGFTGAFTRLSMPLAHSGVVAVVGAVLPTRSVSGVDDDIRRIPLFPDLLPMTMYQRRHAASGSLGLLTSRPVGAWAVGAAVAGEWTERFRQQEPSLAILSVAPGLRLRARVGACSPGCCGARTGTRMEGVARTAADRGTGAHSPCAGGRAAVRCAARHRRRGVRAWLLPRAARQPGRAGSRLAAAGGDASGAVGHTKGGQER